jgi:hypothetical protein
MQAFEIVGWIVESEFTCEQHADVDSEDEDHGFATPVFAGDEGADDHYCAACHADDEPSEDDREWDDPNMGGVDRDDDTPDCNCGTCTPPAYTCIRND